MTGLTCQGFRCVTLTAPNEITRPTGGGKGSGAPGRAVVCKNVESILRLFVPHVVEALMRISNKDPIAHRVDRRNDTGQPLKLTLAQHLLLPALHQTQATAAANKQAALEVAKGARYDGPKGCDVHELQAAAIWCKAVDPNEAFCTHTAWPLMCKAL